MKNQTILTTHEAQQLGNKWIKDWNELPTTEYMYHYSDDAELISNLVLQFFPDSHGHLHEKSILSDYWEIVKSKFPNLKFRVTQIVHSFDQVIVYFASTDAKINAIAKLTINNENKITRAEISYF